jgi:hypothetical protein
VVEARQDAVVVIHPLAGLSASSPCRQNRRTD